MAASVDRPEDMSPNGVLTLHVQNDGDVILVIRQLTNEMTCQPLDEPVQATVEFCTHNGGGRSPRTLQALRNLAVAMAQDNADPGNRAKCVRWSGAELLESEGVANVQ